MSVEYARGNKHGSKTHKVKVPETVNVRAIREKLNMTRAEFAENFGFSQRTLEKWEQGVRKPENSARAYLAVIDHNPRVVRSALRDSDH